MPTIQELLKRSAPISITSWGVENTKRLRALELPSGSKQTINIQLTDSQTGNPISIENTNNYIFKASLGEATVFDPSQFINLPATVIDSSNGIIEIQTEPHQTKDPGVYTLNVGIFDTNENLLQTQSLLVVLYRTPWSKQTQYNTEGPPTFQEIRLFLKDSGPEDNLWLGIEEFDNAELSLCYVTPIRYFNETPPPIPMKFDTRNFWWKYYWMVGTAAQLYFLAARHYRRVHLPYQISGGAVDDKNKSQEYETIGQHLWQDYRAWVLQKKVALNASAAIQTTQSLYSGFWSKYG